MIVVGHQPNYLPWLGLCAKVACADVFVVADNLQFVKRGPFGFQHRAKIRTPDGWQWLTVPVLTKGKYTQRIRDVEINNALSWRRKHWRAVEQNYHGAPHFDAYADALKDVYESDWRRLVDLNVTCLRFTLEALGIDRPIRIASDLGVSGKGTDYIIDLCRKTGADTYLHGRHGRDYADFTAIEAAGIRNLSQEYAHPEYAQRFEGFEPFMAAIDLLLNHGPDSSRILMEGNALHAD